MRNEIETVSYIGEPKSNTAMFLSAKAGHLLVNLAQVDNCLVFAERGLNVPLELLEKHQFEFSSNPQLAYFYFTKELQVKLEEKNSIRKYRTLENGARIGENVRIGTDVSIGAGTIIEHDSIIGDNVSIGKSSVIQQALLADDIKIGENTVIGAAGYNIVKDANGNLFNMPTLGTIEISQGVTINSNCVIAAGLAATTRIGSYTHIDSLCHVHHDCRIGNNVEIASSVCMGGFTTIKDKSFIGIGSKLKNRITIGENVLIGIGSVVLHNIPDNSRAYGIPAKVMGKNKI